MIVRNESKIITRLFDSVLPIIDHWIIADTGSTDNTIEIIENYFKEKNIAGEIHQHVWKNFGYNRTLAMKCAQQSTLDFDYILFLDADMILKILPSFNKNNLLIDVYHVKQGSTTLSYYNTRLIKKTLKANCVGPTHEYYDILEPHSSSNLDDIYIDDLGDGGCKSDKFERDIRLLKQGIEEEPNKERYYFYLARSYECIGDFDHAIEYFKKRIEKGGWVEEIWYSHYSMGKIYQTRGETEKAIYSYLMAYNCHPVRIENVYKIIEMYRLHSHHLLAQLFIGMAEAIINIPKNTREFLFYEPYITDYMVDYETCIIAYYTGNHNKGLQVSNKLLLGNKELAICQNHYNNVIQNSKFYFKKLSTYGAKDLKRFTYDNVDIFDPSIPDIKNYKNIHNPSITTVGNKVYINIRSSNYHVSTENNELCYKVYDNDDIINISHEHPVSTLNFLCTLDSNWNIVEHTLLVNDENFFKFKWTVKGIEDIRIIEYNNDIYFVGNTREATIQRMPRMVLGKIKNNNVESITLLNSYEDTKCQKNWSPFVYNNKLLMLYSFDPLIILEPDLNTGTCTVFKSQQQTKNYSRFSGGSQGFYINDYLYFITHEIVHENGRYYFHRFIKMNKDLEIVAVSVPFYFENWGIEYVAGATFDSQKNDILISWGNKDKSAYITSLPYENLANLFI